MLLGTSVQTTLSHIYIVLLDESDNWLFLFL